MLYDDPLPGAPTWVRSSFSPAGGSGAEVASLPGDLTGVRHSGDPAGPVLRFTRAEWDAFIAGAKAGEFDDLAAPPLA